MSPTPSSRPDDLDPLDLLIDVYRSGVNSPIVVRVTHKPTGRVAEATDRSQLRAREAALAALVDALNQEEAQGA